MTLQLPSDRIAPDLSDEIRIEAWEVAVAQATPATIAALIERAYASYDRARKREGYGMDVARAAIELCSARRIELAAEGGEARAAHSAQLSEGD